MTSEEQIEEILYEAHAYGVRDEVLIAARKIREEHPKMDRVQSFNEAFKSVVEK